MSEIIVTNQNVSRLNSDKLTNFFNNMKQIKEIAEIVSKSQMNNSMSINDIICKMLYGLEIGSTPLQSMSDINLIKGRACIACETALRLCKNHPDFKSHSEGINQERLVLKEIAYSEREISKIKSDYGFQTDKDIEALPNHVAWCEIELKNGIKVKKTFSTYDAMRACLWGGIKNKVSVSSPWLLYPQMMLLVRARSFAIRTAMPHVLCGLYTKEEAEDIPTENLHPTNGDFHLVERPIVETPKIETSMEESKITSDIRSELLKRVKSLIQTDRAIYDTVSKRAMEKGTEPETYIDGLSNDYLLSVAKNHNLIDGINLC